jgi:hypothetical protein
MHSSMCESNITAYINNSFTFFKLAYYISFSSLLIVFHQFFTWIALGDAGLRFWLIWVRKANVVEEETKWAA